MTTIINTPPNKTETVSTDNGAGWFAAVIILLAVIGFGAYIWFYFDRTPSEPTSTTNINVTLPNEPETVVPPLTE